MPHNDTFDELDLEELEETHGMYGAYDYLTFMAEKSHTGAPLGVFLDMSEGKSKDFDEAMKKHVAVLTADEDPGMGGATGLGRHTGRGKYRRITR